MLSENSKLNNSYIENVKEWLSTLDIAHDNSVSTNIDIVRFKKEAEAKAQKRVFTVKLNYGQNHCVDRVLSIYTSKEGERIPKKDFYPKHYDNGWQNGVGIRTQWQLYRAEFIEKAKDKTILWHEGEKAVDFALARGFVSTCCCGSLAKDLDYLKAKISAVGEVVKGMIIIQDYDEPGVKKAEDVYRICYELNIPAVILPIELIYPADKGDDFVEYLSIIPEGIDNDFIRDRFIETLNNEETLEKLTEIAVNFTSRMEKVAKEVNKLEKTLNEESKTEQSQGFVANIIPQIMEALKSNTLSETEKEIEILRYATLYNLSPHALSKAVKVQDERENQQVEIEASLFNIEDFLSVPSEELDLDYILSPYVSEVLKDSCRAIPTNPEAVLTIMLPCLASIIGTRSRIVVNPETRYTLSFILRTMIVAGSGSKKSPTARLATDALTQLNIESYKKYKNEMQYFKESSGNEPKPIFRKFVVQDASIDGLIKAHEQNPNGFLCYVDEIYGYFKRLNKFNKGGGDDVQRDLELYEGKPLDKTRASDESTIFIEKTAISVTGTIQEVALSKVLDSEDDLTGISARWLIWAGNMPLGLAQPRNEKKENVSFPDLMQSLIQELLEMEISSDLLITDEAYEVWRKWQNQIVTKAESAIPQIANKVKKLESEVIKIAGVLHYYYLLINQELTPNPITISKGTMERAIVIGNHYLRHFGYVITKCQKETIDGRMIKIIELVKKKGEVTAVQVKQFIRDYRDASLTDVNKILLTLIELGKVEQVPTKKGIKIKSV